MRWLRQLACRAFWTALDGRPGPVHLNFSLREPLVLDAPLPDEEPGGGGRAGDRPWVTRPRTQLAPAADAARRAARRGRRAPARRRSSPGAASATPGSARRWPRLADALALPLLADPLSGARRGRGGGRALRRAAARARSGRPRTRPTSSCASATCRPRSRCAQWLHGLDGALQIAFDPEHAWQDPARRRRRRSSAPTRACWRREAPRKDRGWLEEWRAPTARRPRAIAATLGDELSEPRVARRARRPPPARARRSCVASSMPVRDVETFFPARERPAARALQPRRQRDRRHGLDRVRGRPRRGGPDRPADRRRRARPRRRRPARRPPPRPRRSRSCCSTTTAAGSSTSSRSPASGRDFEEHVATPHGLDFAHAAALYGLAHERVETPEALPRRARRRERHHDHRGADRPRRERRAPPARRASRRAVRPRRDLAS